MSATKAIQFRYLSSQLTQAERAHFAARLSDDIIDKALFQYFRNETNVRVADSTNNLLTNIIRARKKKPSTVATTANIKLDTLPKPLIGATASFLTQNDYISLSKCNRYVFLACNSPNLLQKLDLREIENYSQINLALFPSVKILAFCLSKFNQFPLRLMGANTVMNDLTSVLLHGEQKDDIDIQSFMSQNCLNTNNITTIRFDRFGSHTKFMNLLTKFPNIQCCSFRFSKTVIDPTQLQAICPNLKGLELLTRHDSNGAIQSLIRKFGNDLHFLSLLTNDDVSDVSFGKLQELYLCNPQKMCLNSVVKTAVNLKKMVLHFYPTIHLPPNETKESVIQLMSVCKQLEYIMLIDDSDGTFFGSILEGIEKGLYQTRKTKRKRMKIHIQLFIEENAPFNFKATEFMFNILNVIHWLQMSEINDFMLILSVSGSNAAAIGNEWKKECESVSTNVVVRQVGSLLVISNDNCSLVTSEHILFLSIL